MYIVKVHLLANTDDNPSVRYYNNIESQMVFNKYLDEGKLSIIKDDINGNEREIWYSYIDKDTRDQLKSEVEVLDDSYKNDVTVTILEEGYDLA